MNRILRKSFAVFFLLSLGLAAQAQLVVNPCAKDIEQFCKGVAEKRGDIVGCLTANKGKLSAACVAHDENMKEIMKDLKPSCNPDYQKLCAAGQPVKGYVTSCLTKNKKDLSAACKKEMGL